MLVLSRKIGERIVIGDTVVVQVLAVRRGQIRLGITAPSSVPIRREELPRVPPEEREQGHAGRAAGPTTSHAEESSDELAEDPLVVAH